MAVFVSAHRADICLQAGLALTVNGGWRSGMGCSLVIHDESAGGFRICEVHIDANKPGVDADDLASSGRFHSGNQGDRLRT